MFYLLLFCWASRWDPDLVPAESKDAFQVYLGCPLPGEGPDGHVPLKANSFGPASGVI
jgi:hypothetical protein